MVTGRQFLVELLRALCVLGLLFLNLAHVPAATAGDDGPLCGPTADAGHNAGDDEPCPACRLGDAGCALPPVPPAPPFHASIAVRYGVAPSAGHEARGLTPQSARGPPLA